MRKHGPDTAVSRVDRAVTWSAETLAGASPALSGIASLGLMLVIAASEASALPNSVAAGGGITPVRPGTQQAAALNPPRGSDQAASSQHFADLTLPGLANAASMAMDPGATEIPSWLVALSLDGTVQQGVIGTREDVDYFLIDVEELTMAELSTSADFLSQTVLLDRDGHELVSSDRLIRRLLPAGRYYLRVSAYRYLSSAEQSTGTYSVVGQGTSASPTSITLGEQSHEGAVDADSSGDYFQFEVTEPKQVDIYTIGGLDSLGQLFDSAGRWLAENDDGGDGSNFRIQRVLWPGQYYLKVSGKSDETASYTLQAEEAQLSSVLISDGGSQGNIEQQFEQDYFRFEITEGSEAVIYTEGNLDTQGELLDASGRLIAGSDSGGEGSNFRMRSLLTQPGEYYLRVQTWGGSTGEYTVHAEQTTLSPVELSLGGSPHEGAIEAEQDGDYFQFQITALTEAAIYTVGGFDSFGKLLDTEGREITSRDDGGDGDNFRIERLLWPGSYYLRVSSSFSATTGSYTLHLEGTQPSVATLELDGTAGSGAIMESGQSDFFRIETTGPTAAVIHTSGVVDTAGSLHDAGGKQIVSNDDGGEQFVNFRIAAILLRPGQYTVRVFSSSGDTGSYSIHANGIAGE